MLYIGLDVHSKWMTVKALNPETGEVVVIKKLFNDPDSVRELFSKLDGPLYGAMESGTNAWAMYRELKQYFEDLIVVDPATVWGRDVRRGPKTDERDALGLAVKLSRGQLVGLYVPDEKTQDLRALGRARVHASQRVTKLVNEMGSLLRSWGVIVEKSLLSKEGQKLIESSRARLPEHSQMILDQYVEMLRLAQQVENKLEAEVTKQAQADEGCNLLMSIPGVGAVTALVVRAEIGDITRFSLPAQLVRYCGLSPTTSSSGGKTYYGRLEKYCNRFLRYVLVLRGASAGRSRGDTPFRRTYWRVSMKDTKNAAKIAVARQLARTIFSMMRNGELWDDTRSRKYTGVSTRVA